MKASLKLREEQKPLFKAKVPLNILGLPFQSSLLAGDSKELSLGLGTFFDSGPSFRLSYRPNDAFNPFSLLVKTGIGHFGSPTDAPMTMTAEFNFLGKNNCSNPRFFLHFKPNFGDFSIKKSQSSIRLNRSGAVSEEGDESFLEVGKENDDWSQITKLPLKSSVESAVSGMEVGANTVLPVRNGAVLKLRWGINFPEGFQPLMKNPMAKMSPHGIPLLVLNKIGIEHVAKKEVEDHRNNEVFVSSADLAETCFTVKRQLETLRFENAELGRALDDLKVQFKGKSSEIKEGDSEFVGVKSAN